MTEPTRYAALAARLLRERTPAKESRLSRDVGISVVAHAMELGRRRRRNARVAVAALGFGVAAAVALAVGLRQRGELACRGAACAGEAHASEAARRVLDAGQSIVAPAGAPTSVVLASGTQIALDEKSMLECRDNTATQRFALLRGGAHLHVAKLAAGERFVVDTPNAEVEVRGTVFGVRIEPATAACKARTTVSVDEGRVEVRAGDTRKALFPGERWTSPCEAPPAEAHADDPPPRARSVVVSTPHAVRASRAREAARVVPALGEQNDLYAAAEAARRGGRAGEAIAAYSRLLARFPNGQLAESALVERARLLAAGNPISARAEAERYLARYPAGFARSEMERLARSP